MSVEITPALRQAAHLMALAQHLTRHPDLVPVEIHQRGGGDAHQLRERDEFAARGLAAWADTLTKLSVSVRRIHDEAYVYVSGGTPATRVLVWTTVPGFLEHLGWEPYEMDRVVAIEELRKFAAAQGVA